MVLQGFDTVYEDWPELFFGVGPDTPNAAREELNRRTLFLQTDLRRAVYGKRIYLGVLQRLNSTEISNIEPRGQLAGGRLLGARGGLSSGLGLSLQWDSRDHDVYTREGVFAQLSGVFSRDFMGSDFTTIDTSSICARSGRPSRDTRLDFRFWPRRGWARPLSTNWPRRVGFTNSEAFSRAAIETSASC